MKVSKCFSMSFLAIFISLFAVKGAVGEDKPQLSIFTDKSSYSTGEFIQFTAAVSGSGAVDVYVAVILPTGEFSCLQDSLTMGQTGVPVSLASGWEVVAGEYSIPLPVIPAWPSGEYGLYAIFAQPGSNVINPLNWLSDALAYFTVNQTGEQNFLIEGQTLTFDLGEVGQLSLTFSDGSVIGTIAVTIPGGMTIEKTVTGTYSVEGNSMTATIETETGMTIDFELIYADGNLTGFYSTSTGREDSISVSLAD